MSAPRLARSTGGGLNRDPDAAFFVAANHQCLVAACKRGHDGVGETALSCPNRRHRAGSKIGFSSHAGVTEATSVPVTVIGKRQGRRKRSSSRRKRRDRVG